MSATFCAIPSALLFIAVAFFAISVALAVISSAFLFMLVRRSNTDPLFIWLNVAIASWFSCIRLELTSISLLFSAILVLFSEMPLQLLAIAKALALMSVTFLEIAVALLAICSASCACCSESEFTSLRSASIKLLLLAIWLFKSVDNEFIRLTR